jgi:Ca-activated chloride channel family protein
LAAEGGGFYLPLLAQNAMETLYEKGLAGLVRSELASRLYRRYHERYHWPLGLAIALLVTEVLLSDRARKPRRPLAVSLYVFVGVGLMGLSSGVAVQAASAGRAQREYEAGRYDRARESYEALLERRPDDPRLLYNAGTAAYQAQDYTNAIRVLDKAKTASDLELQQRALYNLGDALYRQGEQVPDRQGRGDLWRLAAEHFAAASKLNPQDADAKFNLEFVQRKIEELEREPPPQSQDSGQQKPEDSPDQDSQPQSDQPPQSSAADSPSSQSQSQSQPQSQPDAGQSAEPQTGDPEETSSSSDQQNNSSQADPSQEAEAAGQSGESNATESPTSQSVGGAEGEPQEGERREVPPSRMMTPQEAQQMLDAVRQEDRPLIFQPPEAARRSPSRVIKDW